MRIRCGEPDDAYEPGQRCRDCGVGTGEFHWDGCCVERCPRGHRFRHGGPLQQAIACTGCYAENDEDVDEVFGMIVADL